MKGDDSTYFEKIPEENDLQNGKELSFRSYLQRQRAFFGIPFSIYVINYVFIGICEIGAPDAASFRMKSSCLIAAAWAGFWFLRFYAKTMLSFYMGLYGYFYVFINFRVLFQNKIAVTGDAWMMHRGGGGWNIVLYATVFSALFLSFANLLEKEDLIGSMGKWYSEKHKK